mmetsp:Transcript_12335/g.37620  ORF Transcript_12335/g.37620 Transcript_12335/m.37620 type:complete len:276 (+) Transcript_12335:2317-3144(+)
MAPEVGHIASKMRNEQGVDLAESGPFDQLVNLANGGIPRKATQVRNQVLLLSREQIRVGLSGLGQRFVPKGSQVDSDNLGRLDHLAKGPHECTVDAHELLRVYQISFVEDNSYLLLVGLEDVYCPLQFVGNVELVCIKEQQNPVSPLGKPLDDLLEIIPPIQPLFLTGQNSRRVNEVERVHDRCAQLGNLKAVQKGGTEAPEGGEGALRVHCGGVAWHDTVLLATHDSNKPIRCRLWPYSLAWKVSPDEILDERRFADGVLSNKQDHRPRVEVAL